MTLEKHHCKRGGITFFDSPCVGQELMYHVQLFLNKPVERVHPRYAGDDLYEQLIASVPLSDMGHFMPEDPFAIAVCCGHILSPE
jgi:hypothetical protein